MEENAAWRNVKALSLVSLLRDLASEMLVHLVPLFLVGGLGVRTVHVGLIEGIADATASLSKVLAGGLSDRLGRRKGFALFGYGLSAASVPVLAVAAGWPMVLLARFGDRLGKGLRTAPRDALIADSVSERRRGSGFGLHRAADTAGAMLGLLAAMAVIWSRQGADAELEVQTFRVVAAWAIVPAVAAVVVLWVGVRDVRPARSAGAGTPLSGMDPRYRRFLVVVCLFALGNSSDAFLIVRSQAAGFPVLRVLAMVAVFNLVYAAAAFPAGSLSDRMDRRRLMVVGWVLYAAVYVGFAFGEGRVFWALWALYGVYYALTEGVARALVADLVPESGRRGGAFGLYHSAVGVTALPASVIAGVLWQGVGSWAGFGPAAPFLLGAGLALLAALMLARWAW